MVYRTTRLYMRATRLCTALMLLWPASQSAPAISLMTGATSRAPVTRSIAPEEAGPEIGEGLLPAGRRVTPPFGYTAFCVRTPENCMGGTDSPAPMPLTPGKWRELNRINDYVNSNIPERSDMSLYGRREYWTYADTRNGGDCEDLALLKQRLLIRHGWPLSTLSIAVVRQWNGEGHAVLLVTTDRGDLVLDNMTWKILPWRQAPYEWVMRQSHRRPYIWVALDPDGEETAAASFSVPPLGAEPPFLAAARNMKKITASLAETSSASTP